jgi:hypothetical protein
MSSQEKKKLAKSRNRCHARATRLRKKLFAEVLNKIELKRVDEAKLKSQTLEVIQPSPEVKIPHRSLVSLSQLFNNSFLMIYSLILVRIELLNFIISEYNYICIFYQLEYRKSRFFIFQHEHKSYY